MSIIFGPINSRRFGKSLGIDLSPEYKQCNFDCLYCELKRGERVDSYKSIVEVAEVVREVKDALKRYKDIDFLTVTANGEPTLYPHLSKLIDEINRIKGDTKSLILSNSSTIYRDSVKEALRKFDVVKLSLDCITGGCFKRLDRPNKDISLNKIINAMLDFKKSYRGKLQIEILFVKGVNDNPKEIEKLNQFLIELEPDSIDLNTVDRPPAYRVEPLSYDELFQISLAFNPKLNINIVSKNRAVKEKFHYSKDEILETLKRRPLSLEDIKILFDSTSKENLQKLLDNSIIKLQNGFFTLNLKDKD
jgi:wyosine [tRNA(Phe)-imidazoG37] synthetase (radical SAM superfamily)